MVDDNVWVGAADGTVSIFSRESVTEHSGVLGHSNKIISIRYDTETGTVWITSAEGVVTGWKADTYESVAVGTVPEGRAKDVNYVRGAHRIGSFVHYPSADGLIHVLSTKARTLGRFVVSPADGASLPQCIGASLLHGKTLFVAYGPCVLAFQQEDATGRLIVKDVHTVSEDVTHMAVDTAAEGEDDEFQLWVSAGDTLSHRKLREQDISYGSEAAVAAVVLSVTFESRFDEEPYSIVQDPEYKRLVNPVDLLTKSMTATSLRVASERSWDASPGQGTPVLYTSGARLVESVSRAGEQVRESAAQSYARYSSSVRMSASALDNKSTTIDLERKLATPSAGSRARLMDPSPMGPASSYGRD